MKTRPENLVNTSKDYKFYLRQTPQNSIPRIIEIVIAFEILLAYLYSMNRNELVDMKRQIESEYKADIAAVNQLLKRFPEKQDTTPTFSGEGFESDQKIVTFIAGLLPTLTEPFSLNDIVTAIEAAMGKTPNRQTVSTALFRLKEDKKIEVVQKGQGRRPASYKRISK